ncbi:MAG: 2-amino-4-hydroxy-6-hydroxymethyldihydropteridine diphosphokinase [Polaribacter sp.]|jgi:2-amino-4-hydroxy-6-hydroxymethyldihydropteridine diphosphokinase
MTAELVYVGIGSNIGDSVTIASDAIKRLGGIAHCKLIQQSSLYQSEPISEIPQDDYINAVALIETTLEPMTLLAELQAIEQDFYRQRDPQLHWAPRTLDLDIIMFGHRVLNDRYLTVPHREMSNRLFVLLPMLEISGDQTIPTLGSLQYLVDNAPSIQLRKIDKNLTA